MASNPPAACCVERGNFHEGIPVGTLTNRFGSDVYEVGQANRYDRVLVILADFGGHSSSNTQLIADEFSRFGYHVFVPDIIENDPFTGGDIEAWFGKHNPGVTKPVVDKFLATLVKEISPKFLGAVGYCFGAKYLFQNLTKIGPLDAGVVAHPSFVSIEEVKNTGKPIHISAAENDQVFTRELRHQTEIALSDLKTVRYQINLFSGVAHNYSVRGDLSDPIVRFAKEKTLADQVAFLSQF